MRLYYGDANTLAKRVRGTPVSVREHWFAIGVLTKNLCHVKPQNPCNIIERSGMR